MLENTLSKRVLLPFTHASYLVQTLESALQRAETMSAELLLLRVCPTAESSPPLPDEESLYTELRGLQAQLQNHTAHLDSITGPIARSIASYAGLHRVDLILLFEEDVKEGLPLFERVARRASCETMLLA